MALSWVRHVATDDGRAEFDFDIGSNRYYAYAVGGELQRTGHVTVLADTVFESPLLGPLPREALGRGRFSVPASLFDREHGALQLMSFRTADRVGPAISEPVQVRRSVHAIGELPEIAFATSTTTTMPTESPATTLPVETTRAGRTTVRYREQALSEAQFIEAILGGLQGFLPAIQGAVQGALPMLQQMLPHLLNAAPAVAQLLPAIGGMVQTGTQNTRNADEGARIAALLSDPATAQLLQVLAAMARQQAGQPAAAPAASLVPAGASTPLSVVRPGRAPLATSMDGGIVSGPVAIAAIGGLISAALPLIGKVFSPENIQAVMKETSPEKLVPLLKELGQLGITPEKIGAIMKEMDKSYLEWRKQEMDHIERMVPDLPDEIQMINAIRGMSVGEPRGARAFSVTASRAGAGDTPDYERVDSVDLTFDNAPTVVLFGRERLAYRHGAAWTFPLRVETPRAIRHAELRLLLLDPHTRRRLVEERLGLEEVRTGLLPVPPRLSGGAVSRVPIGADVLVRAELRWQGRGGRTFGTSRAQIVHPVGELAFDRVEPASGPLIPLNDVQAHRAFWHKVWQGSFTRERRRVTWNVKYLFAFDPRADRNARMDTEEWPGDGRGDEGRLQAGLVVAPPALNRLIPLVSDRPVLSDAELGALRTPDFTSRFSLAARRQVRFRGGPGDSAALWVYPEVRLQRVVLRRVRDVNPEGQVTELEEHPVHVPIPGLIHLVGARSE